MFKKYKEKIKQLEEINQQLNDKLYKSIQGKIGMVFQNYQLFDNLTVIDNLTLAPVLNKLMSKADKVEIHKNSKEDNETSYVSSPISLNKTDSVEKIEDEKVSNIK